MKRMTLLLAAIAIAFGTSAYAVTIDGTEVPVCGGFAGLQCSETEWCSFAPGAECGIGDQYGTCRARPEVCTDDFNPVCGCDAKTYGNTCEAAAAGVSTAYVGACRSAPDDGTAPRDDGTTPREE